MGNINLYINGTYVSKWGLYYTRVSKSLLLTLHAIKSWQACLLYRSCFNTFKILNGINDTVLYVIIGRKFGLKSCVLVNKSQIVTNSNQKICYVQAFEISICTGFLGSFGPLVSCVLVNKSQIVIRKICYVQAFEISICTGFSDPWSILQIAFFVLENDLETYIGMWRTL